MLQYSAQVILSLPKAYQPSEWQVSAAMHEIATMGLVRPDGLVDHATHQLARTGNGGARVNLARRYITADDEIALELVSLPLLVDGSYDPTEVMPDDKFPAVMISSGGLKDGLVTNIGTLSCGASMLDKIAERVTQVATNPAEGSCDFETVVAIFWGCSAVLYKGDPNG